LPGSVAVADAGPDLWSVKGGNRLVPERLINVSNANAIFNTKVTKIVKENAKFRIFTINGNMTKNYTLYDTVIIAAPIGKNLQFENVQIERNFPKYHKLYVYLVSGELQEEFSHLSEILICCDYSNIDWIGLLQPVDDSDPGKIAKESHKPVILMFLLDNINVYLYLKEITELRFFRSENLQDIQQKNNT